MRTAAVTMALLALLVSVGCGDGESGGSGDQVTVRVGSQEVRADVADSPEELTRGLSGREELAADEAMLFELSSASTQSIWMKDMRFPIDIVWIAQGRVSEVTARVPAPQPGTQDSELPVYRPRRPVDRVLEVNAGWAKTHDVGPGDAIEVVR